MSTDFPTANAIQSTYGGGDDDAFVAKINATGSAFVYSTYLGGSDEDAGEGIAVDSAGNAYVTGVTGSTDFPIVNPIQPTKRGLGDAFVTKINASGSALVYSTYLGGSFGDGGSGIAVDTAGNAYVTGTTSSIDFPTVNPFQPAFSFLVDAFVTKISADGSKLVYSTYLGGNEQDFGFAIAVNSAGNAYVTGNTLSTDFPLVNPIQSRLLGGFVTEFTAAGNSVVYSTYTSAEGDDIAPDALGNAYVVGGTALKKSFATLLAFQQTLKGSFDGFVAKIAGQTFVATSRTKQGFPVQVIGTTGPPRRITVTNQGSGTLTINRIYIADTNAGDFAQTNTCGSALAAGATCTISITFTPTAKNKRTAALGISDSDPASPQAVALSGTGTVVSLSKKKLSFGDQPVGTSSTPQNVKLTNVGTTQLNFTGTTITGTNAADFSETNTCGTSIAAGGNCTITVTFKPTAQGTRTATVSISDDGGGSPQKVTLTGTGT